MKSIALCLALLNWPSFGGDPTHRKARTGVYVEFAPQARGGVSTALQGEVDSLLSPLGFDLEWRDAATSGRETWADLAFVTFSGRCNLNDRAFPGFVAGPLGWTHVSDGRIQPYADIDCDRIGALVQSSLPLVAAKKREFVFQRAIARVVAHELYHILAGTIAHQGSGVGKAEFTAQDLVAGKFQFQEDQAQALRERSMRAVLDFSQAGR